MLRHVVFCLAKSSTSELSRLWTGVQPRCCLWQSSKCLQASRKDDGSSSSSSDSDSDGEKGADVDQQLKSAAETVAKAVPGQSSEVKSDLLQQLQLLASQSKTQAKGDQQQTAAKVSDIFSGMKILKKEQSRGQAGMDGDRVQFQSDKSQIRRKGERFQGNLQSIQSREKVKLFEEPGLGIFTDTTGSKEQPSAAEVSHVRRRSLWEVVQQEQLDLFARQPPTNAFEEMIQWTQDGKLWKFPINNEQGMDEEAAVGFHEHVFLEEQIKDFPRRGPVRHFMELVVIGLSKNPYLTVSQKHEHIDWFRQYFKEKQSVLEEAFGEDGVMRSASSN